ncbi:AbiTii domain-containing protein [Neoroseomonas lacus]|uniref:AbiTii domain-containing protein n=1 Tax=Neoroseomonas lacus TaxID=287609 RepID=A0A917NS12_9PROT|nr:hypothetical protein [Neoroseomonas lacus]GGJ22678.1 hypothetical protein GCM10011320_32410 [Neoroseomonas lacus]
MGLLKEIQETLLTDGSSIAHALLKLRFLASRIGSDVLEGWVQHEVEGYPKAVQVPDYRKIAVFYRGSFAGGFQNMQNAPIPPHLISKLAGERWLTEELRFGMAVVDDMIARAETGSQFSTNCADLVLLLDDKVFSGMHCIVVNGFFDASALVSVQGTVRAKVLDLTVKLEREVPAAKDITLNEPVSALPAAEATRAGQITQITVYGSYTQVTNSGSGDVSVNVAQGDMDGLVRALTAKGMPESDAKELATIVMEEKPESADKPFGTRARAWMAKKAGEAGGAFWNAGVGVATEAAKGAAKGYLGLP